jgi:patatin-like phospholipase
VSDKSKLPNFLSQTVSGMEPVLNSSETANAAGATVETTADFGVVYAAEHAEIRGVRTAARSRAPSVADGMTGLALSGGGIRSATFCLGVLQALNAAKILQKIDYLSTVSGGGYIGASMTVAMSTSPANKAECFPFGRTGQEVGETDETRHLRDNSRYLLQNGIGSALSAVAIYLRGIVMNVIIVLPFLLAAAALLVFLKPDTRALASTPRSMMFLPEFVRSSGWPLSLLGAGVFALFLMLYAFGVSISPILKKAERQFVAKVATIVLVVCALPVLFEAHFAVLRVMFGAFGPAHAAAEPSQLFENLKQIVAWVTPVVVAVLPFVRQIAEKAVSSAKSGFSDLISKWTSRLVLIVVAAVVPLLLWLSMLQLAYWAIGISACTASWAAGCVAWGSDTWDHAPSLIASAIGHPLGLDSAYVTGWGAAVYALPAALLLLVWLLLNVNSNSLHQLYRDRLGSAFLFRRDGPQGPKVLDGADTFKFTEITPGRSPYHLVNTALNLPGSNFANRRGRNADFFMFSRLFTGSEATGYVSTKLVEQLTDGLNVGTAMAISGAAAAPNMGMASMRPLSATIALLNVRLGRWLRHPADILRYRNSTPFMRWWRGTPGPIYLLREAFFKSGANVEQRGANAGPAGFVFLTDGGHIENLGVYELLRRRCAVIVAVDAEADPDFVFGSLVQLQRFARIDLGIRIVMDWAPIGEGSLAVSENMKIKVRSARPGPHVALGLIDYPPPLGEVGKEKPSAREQGVLIYIKSSISGDESDYVTAYKSKNQDFPQQSTMEQLFSEEQFEVYRALGEHIARRFVGGDDAPSVDPAHKEELTELVEKFFPEINLSGRTFEPATVRPAAEAVRG